MASKQILYDASGKAIREIHYADPNDIFSMIGHRVQYDLRSEYAAVEAIKAESVNKRGAMRHARRIPQHVVERAMIEGWFIDNAAWRRWANSPEGRTFATHVQNV